MSRLERLMSTEILREQDYTCRDTILYALGCGAGANDPDLVWEQGLRAIPSMAAVLGSPGNWYADPALGLDAVRIVHGSERVELASALPVQGRVRARTRIVAVNDKGEGRGALIVSRREIEDAATGRPIACVTESAFARGDGGIGSAGAAVARQGPMPSDPPDRMIRVATSPRAAAIYRLMGDDNPLHIDPAFARQAGFPGPILHGLATYGHLARAIMRDAPARPIRMMDCRFTAPVFPGCELHLSIWDRPGGCVFRAEVAGLRVVDHGEIAFD